MQFLPSPLYKAAVMHAMIRHRPAATLSLADSTATVNTTMPETVSRGIADRPHDSRVAVLRCLVTALVITILLAGLVVLIFWLVVRPKPIEYTVTRAVVRHFNVTPPPGATLNATFYLTLASNNPNRRVSMLYESVEFYVLYGEAAAHLAVAAVPAFRQPHRNETRLNVRPVARSAPVVDQAARELEHDRAAGMVSVDVRMNAGVRFMVGGVKSRYYSMQAICSPVVIGLSPSSARSFQSVSCDVGIL